MWENLFQNIWTRIQLAYTRMREIWHWGQDELRAVRWSVALMILVSAAFSTWTRVAHSNAPARYGMLVSYLIYIYVVRLVVGPVFFAEVGMTIWRRGAALLPSWLQWLGPKPSTTTPAPDPRLVWHQTSISGNVFHIISTIWMWSEVFLFLCGLLPVWKEGNFSAVIMFTVLILLFVGTEDFASTKKWRARFIAITMSIAMLYFIPMAIQALVPGTYELRMASYNRGQTIDSTVALATTDQIAEDVGVINALSNKNLELAEKFRRHIADGTEWTTADQQNWLHVRQAIREYKSATSNLETKPSHSWRHGSADWLSSVWYDSDTLIKIILTLIIIAAAGLILTRRPAAIPPVGDHH